ncbi:MAG TPA: family 43 glycosylhydrolase [Verrucomicrobiae bacterium]|nr:family 43 glycosylhydrolase [Verrucomicrobiae bacterium]
MADYPIESQRYAADPTGVEFNGRLYLYCSNDDDNGSNAYIMHSITCFSTDDLKNWTDHGVVFQAPQDAAWATLSWAPSVVSNNNTLYLYFGNGASGIGVATSRNPEGPFTDARGSALISASTPGAATATQWEFDPCAFIDDNGRPYLYFGGQYPTNARVISLNTNLTAVQGAATPMFATNFFEASYMHKRNGIYYFTYSTRPDAGLVIYCETNSNPTNGFAPEGTLLANPPQNVNNNNHHTVFAYAGSWYIAYHNRALALQNGLAPAAAVYKRSLGLERVNYAANGSVSQVSVTTDGLAQLKSLNPFNQVEAETMAQESGIKTEICSEGGLDVAVKADGSWLRVRGVDFEAGASSFFARVAGANGTGSIEVRLDSLAGAVVGSCAVPATGGAQVWNTVSCAISGASGIHDLYLRFMGATSNPFQLNWWRFQASAGSPGASKSLTTDPTTKYQTIEGLGGATAFYAGWISDHRYKAEIYSNAFAGLNISMLRLGDWFRYQSSALGFDVAASDIVSNATRVLGHPVPVYMSSWAPPAFLKSNGQVGYGGTLLKTNGAFAYTNFANYWYDSILAYRSNGVSPSWISIQNEPDFIASYDSCVFHPNEDTVKGTNYASYSKALDAVSQRLTNLPAPPKLLAPEVVGLGFNDVQNYAATMNGNSFYGLAHHLYGGSTDGTPAGYVPALRALANVFPGKPKFMTEYGLSNMIDAACLIHYVLAVEQASGYNFWSLVWPPGGVGLVQIENPYDVSSWTNAPPGTTTQSHGWWLAPCYWSMKHFSYYITPGFRRIAANCGDTNVLASAYLSPDGWRLVAVLINQSASAASTLAADFGFSPCVATAEYQTVGPSHFQSLGAIGSQLALPAWSLTTVVMDKYVAVGAATTPTPADGASAVAVNATLGWSPGTNAAWHALYLGLDSNAVATATPASAEFQGILSNSFFQPPALAGTAVYYWRVDEIAGANTNDGVVWSFATAAGPTLAHRYSFNEAGGAVASDSVGGAPWNGSLPKGGSWSGDALTLSGGSSQYVGLPAGLMSGSSNFTLEAWVKLNSAASWSRIFDFGNNSASYMFLTPLRGAGGALRFAITTNGAGREQQVNGPSALNVGVWSHIAMTLAGNVGTLYLNGAAIATNRAMTLHPSSLGSTANNYFGRSQYATDPYLNAALDEVRIYNVALSPQEVAATDALGPNQLLTEDRPALNASVNSPTGLTLDWPLAAAGFKLQFRTNLTTGDWADVSSPAPTIVAGQWQITLPVSENVGSVFYHLTK